MPGVYKLDKFRAYANTNDDYMLKINDILYKFPNMDFLHPSLYDNKIKYEKTFFEKFSGKPTTSPMENTEYLILYKVIFEFQNTQPTSKMLDLYFDIEGGDYILDGDSNLRIVSSLTHKNFQHKNVKSIQPVYPMVYWLDRLGSLYIFNEKTRRNVQYFSKSIYSIHYYRDSILALRTDGTLFLGGHIGILILGFIGLTKSQVIHKHGNVIDDNDNLINFIPIYTNVNLVASDHDRIVISMAPS